MRQKRRVPGAGHQFQLRPGQLRGQKPRRANWHDAVAFTMHHQRGHHDAGKGGTVVLLLEQLQSLVQRRGGRFAVAEHFVTQAPQYRTVFTSGQLQAQEPIEGGDVVLLEIERELLQHRE